MKPVNINQVDQAIGRNIDHLSKDNYNKLIKIFMLQMQELQEATISVADQRNIATSQGVWLDYIGKIVGESRLARDDISYRKALLLKIGVNSSDGTPESILNLVSTYTETSNLKLIEYPLACFMLSVNSSDLQDFGLQGLIDKIKPVGVTPYIFHNTSGENLTPAWEIRSGLTIIDKQLLLDNGGILLLDDGLDIDNYLIITESLLTYYNNEYSKFLWGSEVPVKDTKGKLAQGISINTTK